MSPPRALAAWFVLALGGCDPNVVVGHASQPVSADAAPSEDASAPEDSGPRMPAITWATGVHTGNDLQEYLDFGTWRARPLDLLHVFTDRTTGWPGIVEPSWPLDMLASFAGRLVISQPLYPETGGYDSAACAAGAYDAEWAKLGTFLVERGRGNAILRLGWGFNDGSHVWAASADLEEWLACFRRVVDAVRSTAPDVEIDWSFNAHGAPDVSPVDPYDGYPGDAYVDYVGLEAFDDYPPSRDDAAWQAKCASESGLCRVIEFARAHGKQVGIAEWGVVGCGGDPGGDNPLFVQKMVETFADNANVLAYEAYFEDGGLEVCSDLQDERTHPESAARYRALYATMP